MKQYCRYCARCVYGDIPYCEAKEQTMSETYIKRTNQCREFALCGIDVISGKEYTPRKQKNKVVSDQAALF